MTRRRRTTTSVPKFHDKNIVSPKILLNRFWCLNAKLKVWTIEINCNHLLTKSFSLKSCFCGSCWLDCAQRRVQRILTYASRRKRGSIGRWASLILIEKGDHVWKNAFATQKSWLECRRSVKTSDAFAHKTQALSNSRACWLTQRDVERALFAH